MSHEPLGIGVDDLAWIQRDQFVHYLTVARRSHDPADWPRFRRSVIEGLTAAFGLDDTTEGQGAAGTAAIALVEETRRACDPAAAWSDFLEALWARRHSIRPDLC